MGVRCVIDDFRLILKKKAPTPFGPISGPNDVGARDCFGVHFNEFEARGEYFIWTKSMQPSDIFISAARYRRY